MASTRPNKVFASPNKILWQFHSSLNRQIALATSATNADECREYVALCIVLSVTLVETFLNLFFRILVSEVGFTQFGNEVLRDFEKEASLGHKIKEWPKLLVDSGIDLSQGIGQKFIQLKALRNWLMHFTSSFETFSFDNITIQGLADISRYEELKIEDATEALNTAEGIIAEILRMRGARVEDIPSQLLSWIGKV